MGPKLNIVIFDRHPLHSDLPRMLTESRTNLKAHYHTKVFSVCSEEKTNIVWELAGDARCDIRTQTANYEELG